jgi:heavy-metal exporter, HME family
VLLTALSAGLALTPLLRGAGEPGLEILHPVAVTIFGGLLSSTLLDAVLTPTLFLAFGRKPLERFSAIRVGALAPTTAADCDPDDNWMRPRLGFAAGGPEELD